LLFHASAETFRAECASGDADPIFAEDVLLKKDATGAPYFECRDFQKFAYSAPGNVYAARGTLSFFWRSRYAVGPTPFPIFRVGYSDHTSWDACFLRVDYNGEGFEAFVSDINLSRARVDAPVQPFPEPARWTHIAVAWDEGWGIRLYIDGKYAADEVRPAVYDAGLSCFGPHSRILSHWQIQSEYNFIRGGDVRDISIYDRMLPDESIAALANGRAPQQVADDLKPNNVRLRDPRWAAIWKTRTGWRDTGAYPPALAPDAIVRKVEVHDAYDLKRWYWKALDGIRETTWPGVYNRSRLKGRNDYFQLPDWDCYTLSGRSLQLRMPNEPYNHIEIAGSATGSMESYQQKEPLFQRTGDIAGAPERTAHRFAARQNDVLLFVSDRPEEPIGDISAFYVTASPPPLGERADMVRLDGYYSISDSREIAELQEYVRLRHLPEARGFGFPTRHYAIIPTDPEALNRLPSLDGVALRLPKTELNRPIACAVRIHDPLWPDRALAHFSFAWDGRSDQRIFFDTRDRVMPDGKPVWITLALSDDPPESFWNGLAASLVLKSRADAKAEHSLDRFTQARDNYAHLVEENPDDLRYGLFRRFYIDILDLMRVDPAHIPGSYYYYEKLIKRRIDLQMPELPGCPFSYKPELPRIEPAAGVPTWAFEQTEALRLLHKVVRFYIDERQIDDGEFGGGLSDDGDFMAVWSALAALGCDARDVTASLFRCLDAFYNQGMFTNGLPSIQADELHSAEEGLIALGAAISVDRANPKLLERAMETARSMRWLTGVNSKGERLFRSSYYSGSRQAREAPWNMQWNFSPLTISPVAQLIRHNGAPDALSVWLELTDTLMKHIDSETGIPYGYIRFDDSFEMYRERSKLRRGVPYLMPYTAYRFTGDARYLAAVPKEGAFADPPDERVEAVAARYLENNDWMRMRMFYMTEGSPWIDRVYVNTLDLQRDRLGGAAHIRDACVYPTNRVSWRFPGRLDALNIAVLFKESADDRLVFQAFNLTQAPLNAHLFGEEITPGRWRVEHGAYSADALFEMDAPAALSFPPGLSEVSMRLVEPSVPYWRRCDLAITREDITHWPHGMNVRVHSIGGAPSAETDIALKDAAGRIIAREIIPALDAPTRLTPVVWEVIFPAHKLRGGSGWTVEIDPDHSLLETSKSNNIAVVPPPPRR
jgi:hypothetical protein